MTQYSDLIINFLNSSNTPIVEDTNKDNDHDVCVYQEYFEQEITTLSNTKNAT